MKKTERVLLHLCASLNPFYEINEKKEVSETNLDRSTILVGDGVYNGIYFPKEELEKFYQTFNKQPININHSDKIEDIVGYITKPKFENDKITVKPVLDSETSKYNVAQGYINSRIRADSVPEVSIGVWIDKTFIEEEDRDNYPSNAVFVASNGEGDHLSIVTRGACSPKDGCGIGLQYEKPIPIQKNKLSITPTITITFDDSITKDWSKETEELKLKIEIEKEKLKRR